MEHTEHTEHTCPEIRIEPRFTYSGKETVAKNAGNKSQTENVIRILSFLFCTLEKVPSVSMGKLEKGVQKPV